MQELNHETGQREVATVRLDTIDRRILSILQQNSRASTKQIANMIGGISKVTIAYRIRKLMKQGVIEEFTAKINGDKVDRGYVIITRIVCSTKGLGEREVARKIAKLRGVQSVYQVFGAYDIVVTARCRNKESTTDLLQEIWNVGGVRATNTMVASSVVKESVEVDVLETPTTRSGL